MIVRIRELEKQVSMQAEMLLKSVKDIKDLEAKIKDLTLGSVEQLLSDIEDLKFRTGELESRQSPGKYIR